MKFYALEKNEAAKLLEKRAITVAVVGQGKMGLPISVIMIESGFNVIGVDNNPETVEMINQGNPPILKEPGVLEGLQKGLHAEKYRCTLSMEEALKEADIIIIIIPLVLDKSNNPLFDSYMKLIEEIGKFLQKGQLVILETTLPPGTTSGIFVPILEDKSNLNAGIDFGVGYSPERTASGQVIADIKKHYPKIISGIDQKSLELMDEFYTLFAEKGTIKMDSTTAAETVKVFEGVYRDVNIALANEFAKVTEKLGLNISSIVDAANSQPYSHIHRPGPGVGGHCIPVYPHFLSKVAEEKGIDAILTKIAREINNSQPQHVVEKIKEGLNLIEKPIDKAKIMLVGLAYRGGVKESRNSPTIEIIKLLKEYPVELILTDPLFSEEEVKQIIEVEFNQDVFSVLKDVDCVVLLTNHIEYSDLTLKRIEEKANKKIVVIDTKQVWEDHRSTEFEYLRLIGIGY